MSTFFSFENIINSVFSSDFQKHLFTASEFTILLNSLFQIYSSNPYLANACNRKKTFTQWNNDENLIEVANQNGFYYTGIEDETICVGCGLGLKSWARDDCPMALHAVHSPFCSFVMGIEVLDLHKDRLNISKNTKAAAASQLEAISSSFKSIIEFLNQPLDAINNARGIGHSDTIISLAAYRNLMDFNTLPCDTISLLRSIMRIDDELEINNMCESDLPPFVDFLKTWNEEF